ncbi:MAG: response regulator [Acidobacteriota bacterium]
MRKILLVEDNADDVELTLRAIEKNGIPNEVVVAGDGQEALDYLFCAGTHAGRDMSDLPEVVLLDLRLPKVDGLDVLRRIRAEGRTRELPVILLSASDADRDVILGHVHGATMYFRKPAAFQDLVEAMRQMRVYWSHPVRATAPQQEAAGAVPLRVLVVENEPADADLVVRALTRSGYELTYERVETAEAMREALARMRCDIIISDYTMPRFDAPAALRTLHDAGLDIPFIVVSGSIGEETAVAIMRDGAHDCIMKGDIARLVPAVERELREARARLERQRALDALRRSEARFRTLVENVRALTYTISLVEPGRLLYISPQVEHFLGFTPAEWLADPGLRARQIHPEDRARVLEEQRRSVETASPFVCEYRMVTRDGRVLWLIDEAVTVADSEGRPQAIEGIARDITAQRQAEEALRASEEQYRLLFERSVAGVLQAASDGRVERCNRALARMLGYGSPEEIEQLEATALWWDPAERQKLVALLTEKGQIHGYEMRGRTKDGRAVEVLLDASLIDPGGGAPPYILATGFDATERKRLEQQLVQSQKMDAIGRLAGGVAHDFNNLLTAILGYCYVLESEIAEGHPLHDDVIEIRKAGERAAGLTRQLLAFSRKQVVLPRILNLNATVTEMEKMLRRIIGEDVDFVMRLDPGLGKVKADPGQVEQVIANLCVNARDAMPRGGRLVIETANREVAELPREHHQPTPGSYVILAIADTGTGMDDNTRSHLFEPFFTTKPRGAGTGLGLATVYGIVKQSGGGIEVETELGKGTTFRVYLPRTADETAEKSAPAADESPLDGSETILLVEDEENVRRLARTVLSARGYTVLDAGNASAAVEKASLHKGPIHLILTDVVMPGVSGPELVSRLKPGRPEAKVLYVSGYMDDALARHGVLGPGNELLEKPFSARALARKVREVLDG